jgi:hypothetical protein
MSDRLTIVQAIIKGTTQAAAFVTGLKFLGLAPDLVSSVVAYVCLSLFVRLETKRGFDD